MPVAAKMQRKKPRNSGNQPAFCVAIAGSAVGFGVSWPTRPQHAEGEDGHRDERAERHPRTAPPVGQPAAERPGQRADAGAEEGVEREVDAGAERRRLGHPEVELDQQRHRGGVADERPEGADVEHRQQPRLLLLHDLHLLARRGRHGREVVHPEPRGGGREQRQPGIDVRRPLEVDAAAGRLHQAEDAGAADHHREQQLDQRDAEVAAGRVEAERRALLVGRGRRS